MAIIHTTPRQSGTEGLLKLLHAITEDVILTHGKILMGQVAQHSFVALKLSLFIVEDVYEYIGVRNVYIEDVGDSVHVCFGNQKETNVAFERLHRTKNWIGAFPASHRACYHLTELTQASVEVRDYLLLGKRPATILPSPLSEMLEALNATASGIIEFNVASTFTEFPN